MRPKFESFSKGLENPGLICASCHVREHTRYGPPPSTITSTKPGSNKPDSDFYLNSPLPHNGFIPKKEFENSQFCKNCHQSKPTGVLLNGKQLMETYSEWEQSDFAQKKISCQSCHMESRSHTWKGIHDKEFVRNALDVQFSFKKQKSTIEVIGSIESRKIGHSFPTYTIPQIHLELFVIQNGKKISIKQASIGRLVDSNLTQEYYDTRLKPGEKLVLISEFPLPNSGELTLGFQVDVDPDELYVRTFEENLIDQKELSSAARRSLRSAIREKKSSKYNLFTSLKPVPLL
ncbi:MAG: cytochrome c554 and C-prime [Leptospira sp.]|nr:cytochrome c554 and C-prime [Leptospira sp.]